MVFRRRRLKRPISIAKSVYGYIRTKVTAGRHFRTDLSVQKSERVNKFMHLYCNYFEHTTITHICNHLKQLIKFNYLQYKKNTIAVNFFAQLNLINYYYLVNV